MENLPAMLKWAVSSRVTKNHLLLLATDDMISDQSRKVLWKRIHFINCLNVGSETDMEDCFFKTRLLMIFAVETSEIFS